MQQKEGCYLWLGQYDRQVASTINYQLKGDGRLYGVYMKSDSYVEGVGVDEIWQAFIQTKCAALCLYAMGAASTAAQRRCAHAAVRCTGHHVRMSSMCYSCVLCCLRLAAASACH
jgi:hypothetical protein